MNVYLAGKIRKHDWRHQLVRSLGADLDTRDIEEWNQPWPRLPLASGHTYMGPFFTGDDHGCAHVSGSHGNTDSCWPNNLPGVQAFVFSECLRAIRQSDLVFAWLDESDAYGTYAELGFARALHKRIVIALGPRLVRQEVAAEVLQAARVDHDRDELWFVKSLADQVIRGCHHPVAAFQSAVR